MTGSALPFVAILLGVSAAYYYSTRDAQASTGTGEASGPPTNYLTAMNADDYAHVGARLNTQAKPVVLIVFRPSIGGDAISAIQSSAMAQARAYPEIWVVVLSHAMALAAGGKGVERNYCGPDGGGAITVSPYKGGEGSEIYEACFPQAADPDQVSQNINVAAVTAKNLAAQASNS